jgi:hypothetical protein
VPAAAAVGSEFYAQQQALVLSGQATSRSTEAVLTEDAPPALEVDDRGTVLETAPVPATWSGPDGQVLRGTVQANHGAKAGATVPIWTDLHGAPTDPPLSAEAAVIKAISAAVLLWSAAAAAVSLLFVLTRFAHTRLRLRRWELQWEQVSRDWTAR